MTEPGPDETGDIWVLTERGEKFYLADPDASLVDIKDIASALAIDYERLVHPRVKYADRVALATEIRDLMPTWPDDAEPLPPAVAQRVAPLSPERAREAFLECYQRLFRSAPVL